MRPGQWQKSDGGFHNLNETQKIIWRQVEEATELIKRLRKKKRLIVANVGDAIDGNHHDTTEIITTNVEEQERIHIDFMDWFLQELKFNAKRGDQLYYISGSPPHVRPGAQSEERIARDLDAIPMLKGTPEHDYKDGRYVWPRIRLDVNGVLLDIAHHGASASRRKWTRENTIRSLIKSIYFEYLDAKERIPRYWIRADRHVYIPPESYMGYQAQIEGVILPALQSKTEFGQKVAAHELSTLGMFIIEIFTNGMTKWYCPHITVDEERIIKI